MQRMLLLGFYFTMTDSKKVKHHFRMTPQEFASETFEDVNLKSGEILPWTLDKMTFPGVKFSQLISDEDAVKLWNAVR